jgi:hypothetical protein
VVPYYLIANGHDGRMGMHGKPTDIMVVCHNTCSAALEKGADAMRHNHMGDATQILANAQKSLMEACEAFQRKVKVWRAMSVQKITSSQLRDLALEIFDPTWGKARRLLEQLREKQEHAPVEISEAAARQIESLEAYLNGTSTVKAVQRTIDAFHNAPGADLRGETLWGAFGAITYVIDHTDTGGRSESKLGSSWFGEGSRQRQKAFNILVSQP